MSFLELKINPEYEKLLKKLPKEEYEALKQSIKNEGQHFLITVNLEGIILDGHHRFMVCKELGLKPKYEVKFFENQLQEKKFVIESNLLRRQLTIFQRMEMVKPLIEIEIELAKERILKGDPRQKFAEGKVVEIVASKIGTNPETLRQGIKIIEEAPEALKEEVRTGKRSISSAYNLLTQKPKEAVFEPKVFTVWNFSNCDERFGVPNFPGRIPGQIVQNVLYYYTNEGDLVVDPFAGSGTTIDVCNFMKRNCLCYDVAPIREEIKKHDIKEGFPKKAQNCDLIFLDPPYWNMRSEKYSANSVSSLSLEDFYAFIEKLAKDCDDIVRVNGIVAFLISNQLERLPQDKEYIDHVFQCLKIFEKIGFRLIMRFSVPLTTQEFAPFNVKRAKEEKKLLGIVRDLLIFQKVN